jgi:uncharacterized DUF497 family protein
MRFEWDEAKNRSNVRKHGVDFNDAIEIFKHPVLTAADRREYFDEDRWIAGVDETDRGAGRICRA